MRRTFTTLALAAVVATTPVLVAAQDCNPQVQAAEQASRQQYLQGMTGLANNNFSSRPSSFGGMACLDKFMKGSMDTFFRPPSLNDLLSGVLNFACQQVRQQITSVIGGGGTNLQSLIGSLSGGLNVSGLSGGGGTVNLTSLMSAAMGATGLMGSSNGIAGLIGSLSRGSSGSTVSLGNLYR